MSAAVAVREAAIEDAEAIARVHVGTWQAAYRGMVPDDYLDSLNVVQRTRRWREGLATPDGPTWVAEGRGAVVGWANAGPSRDVDPGATPGELYGIYVDPKWWGRGPSAALMDEALAWLASRFPAATLWTLERNGRARRFYERCGWLFDGTTKQDDRGSFVLDEVRYRIDLSGTQR